MLIEKLVEQQTKLRLEGLGSRHNFLPAFVFIPCHFEAIIIPSSRKFVSSVCNSIDIIT